MATSGDAAAAVRASVIDGIAWTPRFRERGLAALHGALERSRAEILDTLQQETKATKEEALFQYLLTLSAITTFHASVHPHRCHDQEYRIARSKDHREQRRPYGYAYITPAGVDELYTIVVAVTAAFAAGNCVLLQQQQHPTASTRLSQLLEKLLTSSLSAEVFACVSNDPFDSTFQRQHRVTVQPGGLSTTTESSPDNGGDAVSLIRCTASQNVAIVDRSADLRAAARDCVHARFAFGGRSAYAPDLVLVNDFCVQEFAAAVAEAALQYLAGRANGHVNGHANGHAKTSSSKEEASSSSSVALTKALERNGTVLATGDNGKVVLLHSRDPALLSTKVDSPTLIILPVTSVDDAIDLVNSTTTSSSSHSHSTLTAAYIYASPAFAKYVSQFLRTSLSLVNHIPAELLIGPPAPVIGGFTPAIHPRLSPNMFSLPSPALIEQAADGNALAEAIWPSPAEKTAKAKTRGRRRMEDLMTDGTSLTPVQEPLGPAVGFFEQGFLFGASLVLSSVIAGGVLGFKYGLPALMARLSSGKVGQ